MRKHFFLTILYIILISLTYISLTIYINNYSLINNTLTRNYPTTYKYKILKTIFTEFPHVLPSSQLTILYIVAILTAANLILLYKRIKFLKQNKSLKLIIGTSTLLGLTTTSCAACGIPLLALLGITTSLTFLPLKGTEFSLLTITLLILSLIIIYKNSKTPLNCNPIRKTKKMIK